jgi:hypothetical protein
MLKYIFIQMRRGAVTNTLFILLLAFSGVLFCITAALWFTAQRSLRDVDEIITTIGIPDMRAIRTLAVERVERNHVTELNTPLGVLVLEDTDRLTLDGVDFVQNYLEEQEFESVSDLMGAGIHGMVLHGDGSIEALGIDLRGFIAGDGAAWGLHSEFNNIDNIVYLLGMSAEENLRNNAIAKFTEESIDAAQGLSRGVSLLEHEGLLYQDERRLFGAFSDDAEPIPMQFRGHGLEPRLARLSPQGFVVLAVTVREIHSRRIVDTDNWFSGTNISHIEDVILATEVTVDEVLHGHPDLQVPSTITINNMRFSDGSYAFEEGASYIVFGNLRLGAQLANYFFVNYPDMDSVQTSVGHVDSISELMDILNPDLISGFHAWAMVRVPAEMWAEIAEQMPLDEYVDVFDEELDDYVLSPVMVPVPWLDGSGWAPMQQQSGIFLLPEYLNFRQHAPASELNQLVIDDYFLDRIEQNLPSAIYFETEVIRDWWIIERHILDLPRDQFPIEVMGWANVRPQNLDTMELGFIELRGSLDNFLASEQWAEIAERIELNSISESSFRVLTTNDPISIFDFQQQRNLMLEGRSFTRDEVRNGERVALVSRDFAEHNGLSVGDSISIQLYNAALDRTIVSFTMGYRTEWQTAWIPTTFHPELELSESADFTIVGIYRTTIISQMLRPDHAVSQDTVIIPDRSVHVLEGVPLSLFDGIPDHTPLIDDSLIVANGRVDEVIELLNSHSDGLGYYFTFFDQGYEGLVAILNNLLFGTTWIFALAAAAWAVVAFVFAMFYVARKKKEAALLHAMGSSHTKRTLWIFSQCAVVIVLALIFSLAIALPLYSDIVTVAAGAAEEFAHELRDLRLSDAADTGLRASIPISEEPTDTIVAAGVGAVLLLIIAALVSARSSVFQSLDKIKE